MQPPDPPPTSATPRLQVPIRSRMSHRRLAPPRTSAPTSHSSHRTGAFATGPAAPRPLALRRREKSVPGSALRQPGPPRLGAPASLVNRRVFDRPPRPSAGSLRPSARSSTVQGPGYPPPADPPSAPRPPGVARAVRSPRARIAIVRAPLTPTLALYSRAAAERPSPRLLSFRPSPADRVFLASEPPARVRRRPRCRFSGRILAPIASRCLWQSPSGSGPAHPPAPGMANFGLPALAIPLVFRMSAPYRSCPEPFARLGGLGFLFFVFSVLGRRPPHPFSLGGSGAAVGRGGPRPAHGLRAGWVRRFNHPPPRRRSLVVGGVGAESSARGQFSRLGSRAWARKRPFDL